MRLMKHTLNERIFFHEMKSVMNNLLSYFAQRARWELKKVTTSKKTFKNLIRYPFIRWKKDQNLTWSDYSRWCSNIGHYFDQPILWSGVDQRWGHVGNLRWRRRLLGQQWRQHFILFLQIAATRGWYWRRYTLEWGRSSFWRQRIVVAIFAMPFSVDAIWAIWRRRCVKRKINVSHQTVFSFSQQHSRLILRVHVVLQRLNPRGKCPINYKLATEEI